MTNFEKSLEEGKKALYFGGIFVFMKPVDHYECVEGEINLVENEWNKDISEVSMLILEKQQKYLKRSMELAQEETND